MVTSSRVSAQYSMCYVVKTWSLWYCSSAVSHTFCHTHFLFYEENLVLSLLVIINWGTKEIFKKNNKIGTYLRLACLSKNSLQKMFHSGAVWRNVAFCEAFYTSEKDHIQGVCIVKYRLALASTTEMCFLFLLRYECEFLAPLMQELRYGA